MEDLLHLCNWEGITCSDLVFFRSCFFFSFHKKRAEIYLAHVFLLQVVVWCPPRQDSQRKYLCYSQIERLYSKLPQNRVGGQFTYLFNHFSFHWTFPFFSAFLELFFGGFNFGELMFNYIISSRQVAVFETLGKVRLRKHLMEVLQRYLYSIILLSLDCLLLNIQFPSDSVYMNVLCLMLQYIIIIIGICEVCDMYILQA